MKIKSLIFLILFISASCGKNENTNTTKEGVWVSFEKNGLSCQNCLFFEANNNIITIGFNNILPYHDCGIGNFIYRNVINEEILIPSEGGRNSYNIELINNTRLPSCLSQNMLLSLEKNGTNTTIQLDIDVYITKE